MLPESGLVQQCVHANTGQTSLEIFIQAVASGHVQEKHMGEEHMLADEHNFIRTTIMKQTHVLSDATCQPL